MNDITNHRALQNLSRNTGFRLLQVGKLFANHFQQQVQAAIPAGDTFPYLSLFPHIDLEGTRITEIARRMGVSKQAASKLVAQASDSGQLVLSTDPNDGRAKVVKFSKQGLALFAIGDEILQQLQLDMNEQLGARGVASLDRQLDKLIQLFNEDEIYE